MCRAHGRHSIHGFRFFGWSYDPSTRDSDEEEEQRAVAVAEVMGEEEEPDLRGGTADRKRKK